jgi:hypothetical protein
MKSKTPPHPPRRAWPTRQGLRLALIVSASVLAVASWLAAKGGGVLH